MPIISLLPFLPEQWKAITIPESWQVGGDGWDGVDSIKRGMGFFEDIISGKSPPSTGGVALDALLNYMTDDDSDRYRAATTAVAQAGVEVGIASTGVGGAVLLTNAGVQVYGDVIEYTLRNWGGYYGEGWDAIYDQQAVSIGENFDRINLGNLTRDIGHIAADSYPIALGGVGIGLVSGQLKIKDIPGEWNKISQRQLQDYSDLWGHVSDLPGGIFDTGVDLIATGGMNYVASVDYLVSNLPVPGAYQDVVHQNSIKIGSYLESVL